MTNSVGSRDYSYSFAVPNAALARLVVRKAFIASINSDPHLRFSLNWISSPEFALTATSVPRLSRTAVETGSVEVRLLPVAKVKDSMSGHKHFWTLPRLLYAKPF
ncbi:MAG: hypothetical protein IT173_03605 [Acidobacteria bacterium]|nr:hypothetical protein [Acidobacteriota bacterium]